MKQFICAATMLVFLSLGPLTMHSVGQTATDAKALFEKKCSICHSADRPKSVKKTNEEWTKTVTRMKEKRNENISHDEAKIIIDYLTTTYGK